MTQLVCKICIQSKLLSAWSPPLSCLEDHVGRISRIQWGCQLWGLLSQMGYYLETAQEGTDHQFWYWRKVDLVNNMATHIGRRGLEIGQPSMNMEIMEEMRELRARLEAMDPYRRRDPEVGDVSEPKSEEK